MTNLSFELVLPTEDNLRLIFDWRNDPHTREMSRDQAPKKLDSFAKEFTRRYYSVSALPPLFILSNEKRIGFLFFEPATPGSTGCEIAINIAPGCRGKGIATQALVAIKPWIKRQGFTRVHATIRNENSPSIRCFRAAGYSPIKQDDEFVYYTLEFNHAESTHVRIIAEAGSNWHMSNGDSYQAKKLIEVAVQAKCDAVKFQVFRPETTYVRNAQSADYLEGEEDIYTLFDDLAMPYSMVEELAIFCKEQGIAFMASAFSLDDLNAVMPFVDELKIASYEITHPHLIRAAGESGKHTFLSTGAATVGEIDWAVDLFKRSGGSGLTLMQCTAHYPAPAHTMQLRSIPYLQQRYQLPVGLSDHSRDPITAPVAAVALGATAIEKHFTLDNNLEGPDHSFSILPNDLKEMVRAIRETEGMLGTIGKVIDPTEHELRSFAQRRLQATKRVEAGDIFLENVNIAVLRPGKQISGVHPRFLDEVNGKKAKRTIEEGEGIRAGDW